MLDTALELLELGLSVVPLQKNKKTPPSGCTWKEQQVTLPTHATIEERFQSYPDSDLGIITGNVSGIIVVDGDSAEACTWIEKNFPHTWLTVSNAGRGKHYYYRTPGDGRIVKTSAGIVYDAVDIRGEKGLVVIPPSEHKSGNLYQWNVAEGFSLEDLSELPEFPDKYIDNTKTYETYATKNNNYTPGELKNIADQCAWLRHCREDATILGYNEWVWMLSIVSKCVDGRKKCHWLSKMSTKYDYNQCDKKIDEVINSMGAVSCRTIASKFNGCFDCKVEGKGNLNFSPVILGAEAIFKEETQRVSIDDIEKEQINNTTLQLSEKIINPGGLLSLGMAALRDSDAPDIPQYSFPIVISIISRALMGKIEYRGVWPNFYTVKVGGTSTGKTDSDKIMRRAINNDVDLDGFYGPDDFSSGPGLLRGLVDDPQTLINLDEISYLFKRFDRHDPVTSGKIEILLQLFTNCGLTYKKPYGDAKKTITLEKPCVSLIGNATTSIFDNIRPEDFVTGLIQRFTFWCYDGKIPKRKPYVGRKNTNMDLFLKKIKEIYQSKIKTKNDKLIDVIGGTVTMSIERAAFDRLNQFSEHNIDAANIEDDQGKIGIISRRFHEAIKYAMIFLAGTYEITLQSIDYGIALAELLCDWKLNVLSNRVREGQFHQDCEIFKEGIVATIKTGKKPTGKMIANRRPRIKELKPHEFNNVVVALAARKEIEIDDSKGSTKYFLLKD